MRAQSPRSARLLLAASALTLSFGVFAAPTNEEIGGE